MATELAPKTPSASPHRGGSRSAWGGPAPTEARIFDRVLPVLAVLAGIGVVWYLAAVWLNAPQVIERVFADRPSFGWRELIGHTWSMDRPVLPAPHQIALDMFHSIADWPPDSPRSLLYHAGVTSGATLLGFMLGSLLGAVLAVLIVHLPTLERAVFPWIIASQTVPVLAIAPIIIVILGSFNLTGLLPKALISMYLCFFPVVVAMVKGLRSPGVFERELMHTYAASKNQTFWKLRIPASLPFLFPSLRVAIAAGLVGAIVGELPTGAQAGLGARLLTGSYYGNTVQIWSALTMSALLGLVLTACISLVERALVAGGKQ